MKKRILIITFSLLSNIMEIFVTVTYRIYKRAVKTLRQAIKLKRRWGLCVKR
jgi:hypothetical protein